MEWGGDIPAISAINVRDGYIDLSAGVNYGSRALHDRWMTAGPTRRGDVIFTTEAPLGNVAQIPDDNPYILSQRVVLLRPHQERFDSAYLRYFLGSTAFRYGVDARATGSTAEGIKRRHLLSMPILEPSVSEQRAIATFLDRKTAKINELIAKKEQLIEFLDQWRSTFIACAVTGRLDSAVPLRDSGLTALGRIPKHWQTLPLRRLISRIEQGWSPIAEDRPPTGDEWAVIKLNAVQKGEFDPSAVKALPSAILPDLRYRIRHGDFLLTRANTPDLVGDVCVVAVVPDRLMLCDLVYRLGICRDKVVPQFLAYCLLSKIGRQQIEMDARGSSHSMVKVSQGHIRGWTVPVPSLSEQETIVAAIEENGARTCALIADIGSAILRLQELRISLVTSVVTGQIDVREEVA